MSNAQDKRDQQAAAQARAYQAGLVHEFEQQSSRDHPNGIRRTGEIIKEYRRVGGTPTSEMLAWTRQEQQRNAQAAEKNKA
jgi:hypothetical protein